MLKITIGLKEVDNTLNINLQDPTKKAMKEATSNELAVYLAIKELFDKRLLELLEENNKNKEIEEI